MKIRLRNIVVLTSILMGGAMSAGVYASTCGDACFEQFDACMGTLPLYKCQQIYQTCMRQCGP